NASGSALVYSTFLGGANADIGTAVALDPAGDAYVAGHTTSSNFPTTSGAFQTSKPSSTTTSSVFVTEVNAAGTTLTYSTYLGGSAADAGYGVGVDHAGDVFVTGLTNSTNFPTVSGSFRTSSAGGQDGFVTEIKAGGASLAYSGYLGGSSTDAGYAIA